MANVNDAPWLYSALAQVRDIERSGELIPGLGDLRISHRAAMRARLMLSWIELVNLPAPVVSPVSGGGLSITWSSRSKEMKYAFDPDGQAYYFKVEDDEVSGDGALHEITLSQLTQQLQWILDGQM